MSGLRGRLLTRTFIEAGLPLLPGAGVLPPPDLTSDLESWAEHVERSLGPASSVRAVADVAAVPLLRLLELDTVAIRDAGGLLLVHTAHAGVRGPDVLVTSWNEPLSQAWRAAVHRAIAIDARWSLCTNGAALRLVDGQRTWSRDYLEIDLALLPQYPALVALIWALLRGPSITAPTPLVDAAVAASARHGVEMCRHLGAGVLEALTTFLETLRRGSIQDAPARPQREPAGTPHRRSPSANVAAPSAAMAFEHSVTMLYRLLFLLFAEARGLVPTWHQTYRDHYSLDTMMTALVAERQYRGLWQAIRAVSRLAQSGCLAGDLKVNAFNGRLFASAGTAAFDRRPVPDAVMARALSSIGTRPTREGRARILFRDLDVEQLGSIYEQVLEYEPAGTDGAALERTRDVRKSSGAFYTPRSITAFLVRATLEPLVRHRGAEDILRLRVLDPAMGSGAFLVAACRYLAAAAEDARVRDGEWHAGDVTAAERIELRRQVALRCLFGVDLNPVAAQLARLSLWLTTLSGDKPLSFLDHHLIAGDSLVGAGPRDLFVRPLTAPGRRRTEACLPLFAAADLEPAIEHAVRTRNSLVDTADDTAQIVRHKERTLAALNGSGTALSRWREVADLWCAGWFWRQGRAPDRATLTSLGDVLLHDRSSLPRAVAQPLLAHAGEIASERRFVHWPLAFPEVFADGLGAVRGDAGFDAILGNPPWDMVRGDSGREGVRDQRRDSARQLTAFVRESGVYRVGSHAHVNRYQLFVERALQLTRPGGRIGLVVPAGLVSDSGSAALRRHLFEQADVDAIAGFHNRAAIFPVHRSVRFLVMGATVGRPTTAVSCRFGLTDAATLDAPAKATQAAVKGAVVLTRRFIERLSGPDDLGIPEIGSAIDLAIIEGILSRTPALGSDAGWGVHAGREFNASDDRALFRRRGARSAGRPVVEGKHLEPFRVDLSRCTMELAEDAVSRKAAAYHRVGYRDVASASNTLTLIAAIVPAGAVTTHTVFCIKERLAEDDSYVLCALLNSFVANYLVRMRVSTHVTASLVARLPVPVVRSGSAPFAAIAGLARSLVHGSASPDGMAEYPRLQALIARLYGVNGDGLAHILASLPLVSRAAREATQQAFVDEWERAAG